MCLSTIYKDTRNPKCEVLKNVTHVRCGNGMVILTDLMGDEMAMEGEILEADMIHGYFIVREATAV